MGAEFINDVLQPLAVFSGIAMVIWASAKAKLEHRKLDMLRGQPPVSLPQSDAVLSEIKALQQQIAQMQSTSHPFDISFDEALGRLEGRINRLETKNAASTVQTTDTPQTLRNGQGQ